MNKTLRSLFLVVSIAVLPAASFACALGAQTAQPVFMVSVVLQKDDDQFVIKLAHAVQPASSADVATRRVVDKAQQQYPGYSVINTLATPSPESARDCAASREKFVAVATDKRVA